LAFDINVGEYLVNPSVDCLSFFVCHFTCDILIMHCNLVLMLKDLAFFECIMH